MFVVSPWSKGGWVSSETFDHTSVIRFMEERFGVLEPNITPWRRAIAGDLTSAFDFSRTEPVVPPLPDTSGWKPFDDKRHPSYRPVAPAEGTLPHQEPGVRPARGIGYDLDVRELRAAKGKLRVELVNKGGLGAHFQARLLEPVGAPHSYTVGAGDSLIATLPAAGAYDLHLHGPNGFFRQYAGDSPADVATASVRRQGASRALLVTVTAPQGVEVVVEDAYAGALSIAGGLATLDTSGSGGWYDLTVAVPGTAWRRTFAGHLENGQPSTTDPALGS